MKKKIEEREKKGDFTSAQCCGPEFQAPESRSGIIRSRILKEQNIDEIIRKSYLEFLREDLFFFLNGG